MTTKRIFKYEFFLNGKCEFRCDDLKSMVRVAKSSSEDNEQSFVRVNGRDWNSAGFYWSNRKAIE